MKTKEELEQELALLKAKHGIVYTMTTPLNDDEDESLIEYATIYLKKPDRTVHASVNKLAGISTEKAIENFLRSCYVGGDELKTVLENDEAFYSCEGPIVRIMSKRSATLKKN